jgi:tRNA 2-selenouridine synthase
MERVEAEAFIKEGVNIPMVDVRSPAEFAKGHIPGAVNIPIFSDLERAKVGTVYKQQSRDEAIALGLEIVGPKMAAFAENAKNLATNGRLNIYCWRGGMRSEKMAWLFETVGLATKVLHSGYKAYRSFLHQSFQKINNLIVIQGPTGSGKTMILHALKEAGEQVIDLEGLANHKGSAFGSLGQREQPTTQQFQNDILAVLLSFDLDKPIWIESESLTIGRVYLPEELWEKMNEATVLAIDIPREARIEHIVEQYGKFSVEELSSKIIQLRQNMGSENVDATIKLIEQGDLPAAVNILLNYYDKSYGYSATKYKVNEPTAISCPTNCADKNAQRLMAKALELSS